MLHHLLIATIALTLAPLASDKTVVTGKDGASCTKDTTRVYDAHRGGMKITVCWHAAGDPALNGVEVIVDAAVGKQKVTWRDVADVYKVVAVKAEKGPASQRVIIVETSEHTMDDDSQVVARKAVFALKLSRDPKGTLSKKLSVVRRK